MIYIIVSLIIGFIFGITIKSVITKRKSIGFLRIDRSDPEDGPYLFLELEKSISNFENKKYITRKILNKNYISQK